MRPASRWLVVRYQVRRGWGRLRLWMWRLETALREADDRLGDGPVQREWTAELEARVVRASRPAVVRWEADGPVVEDGRWWLYVGDGDPRLMVEALLAEVPEGQAA